MRGGGSGSRASPPLHPNVRRTEHNRNRGAIPDCLPRMPHRQYLSGLTTEFRCFNNVIRFVNFENTLPRTVCAARGVNPPPSIRRTTESHKPRRTCGKQCSSQPPTRAARRYLDSIPRNSRSAVRMPLQASFPRPRKIFTILLTSPAVRSIIKFQNRYGFF